MPGAGIERHREAAASCPPGRRIRHRRSGSDIRVGTSIRRSPCDQGHWERAARPGTVASQGVTPTQLNMTVKNATTMRAPGINGITILNIVILVVLALLVSNKVSQDHKSQMDSAVRASNRLVRAVAAKRDMVKDQRLASDGRVVFEVQPKYTASAPALPGRFE